MSTKPVNVLLVEDDEIDAETIRRAFRKQRIINPIFVARDGIEALEYLCGTADREKIDRPYLILLDINMPRMSGLEFLEAIRADDSLKHSVVFVLTTSSDDKDKMAAYDNHVAGYMVKKKAGDEFLGAISMLDHYWRVVELPVE